MNAVAGILVVSFVEGKAGEVDLIGYLSNVLYDGWNLVNVVLKPVKILKHSARRKKLSFFSSIFVN